MSTMLQKTVAAVESAAFRHARLSALAASFLGGLWIPAETIGTPVATHFYSRRRFIAGYIHFV